jgi:hypothetical protein
MPTYVTGGILPNESYPSEDVPERNTLHRRMNNAEQSIMRMEHETLISIIKQLEELRAQVNHLYEVVGYD